MGINTKWSSRPVVLRMISMSTQPVFHPLDISFVVPLTQSHFSHPTLRPSNILIDAVSLSLLNGSTIDFATELIGSSFRIADNPHAKGSGCGCGVSWELKA